MKLGFRESIGSLTLNVSENIKKMTSNKGETCVIRLIIRVWKLIQFDILDSYRRPFHSASTNFK